jgi:hypothetical protein
MAITERLAQLESLNPDLFAVPSSTTAKDRISLLAIQTIIRNIVPHYVYLEIGSHVGGTLFPHLVDPRCGLVVSVDTRPTHQPDERGVEFNYPGNSTKRMLETLRAHLPHSALLKLATHDADVSDLRQTDVPLGVDLAFIDAEHTNVAVFRDFLAARRFVKTSSIVAFHDANLVCDGLRNIEEHLAFLGVRFHSLFLPTNVFVILMGDFMAIASQQLERMGLDRDSYLKQARNWLWQQIAKNTNVSSAA